jgi:nitroreductase
MEFLDVARKRRSVRAYTPDRPRFEELKRIVDLARRVPSAGFSQGLDFLVLDDPNAVDRF